VRGLYPYYAWRPYPYPPPLDPLALMYSWTWVWMYWMYMTYYVELFRTTLDLWRKLLEATFKRAGGSV